ncbi:flavin-containing monooxygenase [Gulosibacter bifidus]|uniref:Flavin-containing monooxygenase n=1 Tax=Gulosibacter bifidus TaxID=272239 RepID=A0ABW5RJK2_9MICO|nr:NAD(P)-binding domain-containing protein [Gulosibacter bifidus]
MLTTTQPIDIAVIGAGGSGLTAAYSLRALGLTPLKDFVVIDSHRGPGGYWQQGWEFLTLGRALKQGELIDLPGQDELGVSFHSLDQNQPARDAVPYAWRMYENAYDLFVAHGVRGTAVRTSRRNNLFRIEYNNRLSHTSGALTARVLINATTTWSRPFIPAYAGLGEFTGTTHHAYRLNTLDELAGKRVLVVGGGRVAVELLLQLERVGIDTLWSTRREPDFHELPKLSLAPRPRLTVGEVSDAKLRRVQRMASRGKYLPSDVSVRGIPVTREIFEARRRGLLHSLGAISRFTAHGVEFASGQREPVDAVIWATGGRHASRHLAPLKLRDPGSALKVDAAGWSRRNERVAFLGYSPGMHVADALNEAMNIGEDAIELLESDH